MTPAAKLETGNSECHDASVTTQEFDTVRSIYDAMYRGEIDEKEVVNQLTKLKKRNFSLPARVLAMMSRQ